MDARKLCCNLPKIQTKRPILRVYRQKDANRIAKSEDPDQTAIVLNEAVNLKRGCDGMTSCPHYYKN